MSKHAFMAAIRKASLEYRDARGRNPKNIYLSKELASILTGRWKHGYQNHEGSTGCVYDSNHCTLNIYIASSELGKHFNYIGDDKDCLDAIAEHMLLSSTDSKSPLEEEYEKVNSSSSSNAISVSGKCRRDI